MVAFRWFRLLFLAVSVIASSSIVQFLGFVGVFGCAGKSDDATASSFPETCAEVQELALDETGERPDDGTYTLYIDGDEEQPWDAYCFGMNLSDPEEYIDVEDTDNYSQITDGDATVLTTSYTRYRIDPIRLEINPLDDAFAVNDFEDDEIGDLVLPAEREFIPAGWAEMQRATYDFEPTPAESAVSLDGTGFVFDESVLEDDFFCQVDSAEFVVETTPDTEFDIASDLVSVILTAVNTGSEAINDIASTTRMVGDCTNLGGDISDVEEAAWPLQYVGIE